MKIKDFNSACAILSAVKDVDGLSKAIDHVDQLGAKINYSGPLYAFLLKRLEDMHKILTETVAIEKSLTA